MLQISKICKIKAKRVSAFSNREKYANGVMINRRFCGRDISVIRCLYLSFLIKLSGFDTGVCGLLDN